MTERESLARRAPHRRRGVARAAVLALSLVLGGLAGCSEPEPVAAAEAAVRPALVLTVAAGGEPGKLRLAGRVRAMRRAELSFDVPGFVEDFRLDEGTRLQAGDVVARLDDGVYKARLASARAEFERARTDLARYQRLWETELAVARSEVDDRRTRLESARTSLAAAGQDLAATVIRAPFAGVITRRRVEPYTNVQAKQAVAELQDLSALEVVVNVPERLVRKLGPAQRARAFLEGGGEPLPLALKSYAAEADALTQTYQVVLALESVPKGLTLLPGMSVTVEPVANAAQRAGADAVVMVPLAAIAADAQGRPGVWGVDGDGRVSWRAVETGAILGADIAITAGLRPGERIVAAGLAALREGMRVRPLDAH